MPPQWRFIRRAGFRRRRWRCIASARRWTIKTPRPCCANVARPCPCPAKLQPNDTLRQLVTEADRYLASLGNDHAGVAEVRMDIAAVRGEASQPVRCGDQSGGDAAFANRVNQPAPDPPAIGQAIADASPLLRWKTYDGDGDTIGTAFANGHAYAPMHRPLAPVPAQGFELGLFMIAPHVLYRDHRHKTPELCAPLTGPHGWRFGPKHPLQIKPAHQPVWNPANRPHLTKVGSLPFLCLYGRTADLEAMAEVIPADDWTALETLELKA